MNKVCPHCEASFEPEPGFYYGAMFVSYALNVVVMAVVGVALYLLLKPKDTVYLVGLVVSAIVFMPWTFRYSRVLFLYWFGGYHFEPPQ